MRGWTPRYRSSLKSPANERLEKSKRRGEHRVVGNARPCPAMVHPGVIDPQPAGIDAVERHERQHRWKTARGPAFHQLEDFVQVERVRQLVRDPEAPVIEVARDYERRRGRDEPFDALPQFLDLLSAV